MAQRRITPKVGDVFEIPLTSGAHGYGHVLSAVLLGYYDVATEATMSVDDIVKLGVAFRVQTIDKALKEGHWPIIGNARPPPAMAAPISFWRGNAPDYLRRYDWTFEAGGDSHGATSAEIAGLELDSIWHWKHAVARLEMHLRGEPCPWIKRA